MVVTPNCISTKPHSVISWPSADAKEPYSHIIAERRDGEFLLEVADDLMSAALTLVPPQGGRAKSVEVVQAIRAQGITYGILHEQLRNALSAGQCEKLVIAQGDWPRDGKPAEFQSLLEEKEDELSEVDEDAVVQYSDLGYLLLVNVGDRLMQRTPTVPGVNGVDIKGQPVPARPIADIPFSKDCSGAEPDPDNPDLLVAIIAGQPSVIKAGVKVNPIVEIEDVDLSTGNIDFEGPCASVATSRPACACASRAMSSSMAPWKRRKSRPAAVSRSRAA